MSARRGGDVRAAPGVVSVRHPARATEGVLPPRLLPVPLEAEWLTPSRSEVATDSGAIELSTPPPSSSLPSLLGTRHVEKPPFLRMKRG